MPLLLIIFILIFGVSCGREENSAETAPVEYDFHASQLLCAGSEAIASAGNSSLATVFKDEKPPRHLSELHAVIQMRANEQLLLEEARKMLAEGRYNDLALFIEQVEQDGKVTPALLQLRGLPQALQALRLYCARRPFQSADDLNQALTFLRPYEPELALHSPFFREFIDSQYLELTEMHKREMEQKVAALLKKLDWTLACKKSYKHHPIILRQIMDTAPKSPFLAYVASPQGAPGPALNRWLDSGADFKTAGVPADWLELALAVTWPHLTPDRKKYAAEALKKNSEIITLTGTAARAGFLNSASLFEKAIRRWTEQATPAELAEDAPSFAGEYLRLVMPGENTETPRKVPGVTDYPALFLRQ